MRMLASYLLNNYKKETFLAPFFKLLEVIFDLIVPLVVAQIIDVGVANQDSGYIFYMFLVLLLMALIGLLCSFTAQFFAAKASVGVASLIRQDLFDHIQSLSFSELDALGTDTLINRITDDVNLMQNGLNLGLRLVLRSPFIVFGSMIMAFTINLRCALIFAASIPVLMLVVFVIMLTSIPLFGKVQKNLDAVTRLTRENLTGVRVIRAFCRENEAVEEFDQSNRALTALNIFVGRISALLNPLTYVLINIATILLIDRAGVEVNLGNMQQGEVVALYNYMAQMIVELIKLASLIITLNRSAACAGRVLSVLQVKPGMTFPVTAPDAAPDGCAVEFQNVSFTYQGAGAPSLSDISFSAKKGETIGIIGATGSGKSTLVHLISRFYDATEGLVLIDGRPVREYPQRTLREKIGVVPQQSVLFQGSIRDNIKWGKQDATDEEIRAALATAQALEVVEKKDGKLDFQLAQNGRNLSGGQKQRLTIARALVGNPEILILDDCSSALDFATDAALRKALSGGRGRRTTFLVSQRAASLRDADQILVLDDGRLAGRGTHETLMKQCSVYREIYHSQFPEESATDRKEAFS